MWVLAHPIAPDAACSGCGQRSAKVHSRYARSLLDLPAHGRSVHVRVQVRRFRCGNAGCPRRIFAEVLDRFLSEFVSVNSFVETEAVSVQRGRIGRWGPRRGERPTI